MVTKYDVFAEIIENAPCKAKKLNFTNPIYNHITNLIDLGYVEKNKKGIIKPIKNKKTELIFKIISWSIKNNINYNILFTKTTYEIIKTYAKSTTKLKPAKFSNNKNFIKTFNYLKNNQFIIIWKKRPLLGTILNHHLFKQIIKLNKHDFNIKENLLNQTQIIKKILTSPEIEINPFEKDIFKFLTGSAQLEGSTISLGETIDLIINDIYPDKPSQDIQMIKNLNEAMNFVLNNLNKELTCEDIKQLNKLCLFSLHKGAGIFKKTQNKIQGNPHFKTTAPHLVTLEIEQFCKEFNKIKTKKECLQKIGFLHNQFQRIHPFPDGNSRTTRLIINWLLMKYKLPLLILKSGSFDKYMSLTKLSNKRNDTQLNILLLHLILHEIIT